MAGQRRIAAANQLLNGAPAVSNAAHHQAVLTSAMITKRQWSLMGKKRMRKISLTKILRMLTIKKIPFVLTGAHAIGGWTGDPRATADVDILVKPGRNHAREIRMFQGTAAFFVPGERQSIIDVIIPSRPDNEETLNTAIWIRNHGLHYRIPALEAALANKYGAMVSLARSMGKRFQDSADFIKMVENSQSPNKQPIDLARLRSLGEMVRRGGGGEVIVQLVEKVKMGVTWDISTLLKGE
jgi:hypothetical protein